MIRAARLALCLALSALAGCSSGAGDSLKDGLPDAPERITLTSPAFTDGGEIPAKYTCDGANVPSPLRWSAVPAGTRSLAIVLEDPKTPGGIFVHWTVFNIDPRLKRVVEGQTPPGAVEGENSFGNTGYGGPCPPEGADPHRYLVGLYAIPKRLDLDSGAKPSEVFDALESDATARGVLEGRYRR